MTGEGIEYGRRRREGSDEETDRIVREIIDEVRKESKGKESSEPLELPEQVYDPEKCVREAIEEVQQEEAEQLRLKEQKESEEEPQETKEQREIPKEYDVERIVKEAIEEVQQEEVERQRLREEREHIEMEKEEQLEASLEERRETSDKDDFEELEKRICENFDNYGIDPEEVKERWRKRFEEDVQDELREQSRKETEGENDETAGQERALEGHYSYDDCSGQMYEVKMDSKESSGAETESCSEVQEVQEEIPPEAGHETTESKKDAGEIKSEDVTPAQETEEAIKERSKKREEPEQEASNEIETKEVKQANEKTIQESTDESLEEQGTDVKEESAETRSTPEKKSSEGEESITTPESEPIPQSVETEEHIESEDSQDAEEKGEDASESCEKEIWREYEIKHGSLEDENHKRYLKEVFDSIPEEDQEGFNEEVKEKVQTIEDFEELARKHGLEELLEDEEVMEEVRNYLKVRSVLENEPDNDIEKLAEDMGIDVDLAREWSRGESEPYSLKKLLNLEAFYLWDEIIRNYREQHHPGSREELESILESNSELKEDRFFQLEQDDAIAYIEIMAMRQRGKIQRRIRNGREVYSRKHIMELSKKYAISAHEIISWLRGERTPPLIEKIGKISKVKNGREIPASNDINLNEVHRLYFDEKLSMLETGKQLGFESSKEIQRI
ncbi:MAG: hypothetical protein ACTSWQ_06430, partial [Candidatus Thorarchaeota archaeon]